MCVCSIARTFINTPSSAGKPYNVAVVSHLDILAETEKLESPQHIDKLFIFQVPHFLGDFWRKLHSVKFWEILTFVDDPPQYHLPNVNPPPFFIIPPGVDNPPFSTDRTPTYFHR